LVETFKAIENFSHGENDHYRGIRDPLVRSLYSNVVNAMVDRWHFPMLNDAARNLSFKNALTNTIKKNPDSTVLDIGCGTGILR